MRLSPKAKAEATAVMEHADESQGRHSRRLDEITHEWNAWHRAIGAKDRITHSGVVGGMRRAQQAMLAAAKKVGLIG